MGHFTLEDTSSSWAVLDIKGIWSKIQPKIPFKTLEMTAWLLRKEEFYFIKSENSVWKLFRTRQMGDVTSLLVLFSYESVDVALELVIIWLLNISHNLRKVNPCLTLCLRGSWSGCSFLKFHPSHCKVGVWNLTCMHVCD